jgi:proteasome lid subunit RPN8/RPN11
MILDDKIIADIRKHALEVYPHESCGIVLGGAYIRCKNIHERPDEAFRIDPKFIDPMLASKKVRAIIHSHVGYNGKPNPWPSKWDMEQQIATNVPWGMVYVSPNLETTGPYFWGPGVPVAPLIGREFIPGIQDCYALVRDIKRSEQGIVIPEFPRDNSWWDHGENMFAENFEIAGFREISLNEIRPGDNGLFSIRGNGVINHCAEYMGDGMMLHHLYGRLSRIDPVEQWVHKYLIKVVRYDP